jgi:hypothetical protein
VVASPPSSISRKLQVDFRAGLSNQTNKRRAFGVFGSSAPAGVSMAAFPQMASLIQSAPGIEVGLGTASSLGGFHRELIGQETYRKIADWATAEVENVATF